VHVDSSEPAQLNVGDVPVCAMTPCTVYAQPGSTLHLAAINGYSDPCAVDVPVGITSENVTLHPVSASYHKTGLALLIAGIGMTVAGTAVAAIGASYGNEPHFDGTRVTYSDDSTTPEAVGGAIAGAGVGTLVGGIVLLSKKNTAVVDGAFHF
jgi:hypothetical protein